MTQITELKNLILSFARNYKETNPDNENYLSIIMDGIKVIQMQAVVKPAKNVKDFDWLDNKLNDILAQFEHKHITKEGTKDLLFEFIFEDLVNQIQELKDSSLSV